MLWLAHICANHLFLFHYFCLSFCCLFISAFLSHKPFCDAGLRPFITWLHPYICYTIVFVLFFHRGTFRKRGTVFFFQKVPTEELFSIEKKRVRVFTAGTGFPKIRKSATAIVVLHSTWDSLCGFFFVILTAFTDQIGNWRGLIGNVGCEVF